MKMHRFQHDFSQTTPHSTGIPDHGAKPLLGTAMMTETPTKRRWIASVLEAVSETQIAPVKKRPAFKEWPGRETADGKKGFAMRLKAATRPAADAAR
jgi:hypothetical protein